MENNNDKYSLELLAKYIPTVSIQECENINELESVLDSLGTVKGSHKEYSAEKLKYKISQLRLFVNSGNDFDKIPWNIITRTHGIRAKCMELFMYEKLGI